MLSGKETGRDEEQRMSRAWMSPDILHPRPRSELAPGCCAADGVMLPMSGCEPCCYGQPKAASALQRRRELQCHDPPALGVTGLGGQHAQLQGPSCSHSLILLTLTAAGVHLGFPRLIGCDIWGVRP